MLGPVRRLHWIISEGRELYPEEAESVAIS